MEISVMISFFNKNYEKGKSFDVGSPGFFF